MLLRYWSIILYFFSIHGYSQTIQYDKMLQEHGIPDDIIYDIEYTNNGWLWIGTDNGLARFDGNAFLPLETPSKFIIKSAELGDGLFMLGTWGNGYQYVRNDSVFQPQTKNDKLKILDFLVNGNQITGWNGNSILISKVSDDSLKTRIKYLHLRNGKLTLIDDFVHEDKRSISSPRLYTIDSASYWLYNALPGIYRYQNDTSIFQEYIEVVTDTVYTMSQDEYGSLWLGMDSQLIQLGDSIQNVYKNLEGLKIEKFCFTSREKVFFFTGPAPRYSKRQLFEYNLKTGQVFNLSNVLDLKSIISDIEVDKELSLWVATNGDGLRSIRYPYVKRLTQGVNSSFITSITSGPGDKIMVGTLTSGLFEISTVDYSIDQSYSPVDKILTISRNGQGDEIIGADNRILVNGTENSKGFVQHVHHLDNDWWMVWGESTVGLVSTKKNRFHVIHLSKAAYEIRGGDIDLNSREIFLATSKGILVLKLDAIESYNWQPFFPRNERLIVGDFSDIQTRWITKESGLESDNVFDIAIDKNREVWVATDKSLSKIVGDEIDNYQFQLWPERISCMHIDENDVVWIGGKNGLTYYQNGQFGLLTSRNGLISDQVTSLFGDELGQLWVGGIHGLSVFDNSNPPVSPVPITVELDHSNVNGIEIKGQQIQLNADDRVTFNFIDSSLKPADEKLFRIKQGDEKWQVLKQPFISYYKLGAGELTFEVAARHIDGVWGPSAKYSFYVEPYFWETWYFKLFMAIGAALLFIFLVQRIKKQNEKKYREKVLVNKRLSELELKALQAQMNPHFIFNSLNSIQMILWDRNEELAKEYLTQFGKLMRLYLESSRNEFHLLEDEIELINLYVAIESLRFKDIEYSISIDAHTDLQMEFPTMILQPFVENAINHGLIHSKDQKRLEIRIQRDHKSMSCEIEDNGIGRKAAIEYQQKMDKNHLSRATQIIEEKIRTLEEGLNINVTIQIIDKNEFNDVGTLVKIDVPILE